MSKLRVFYLGMTVFGAAIPLIDYFYFQKEIGPVFGLIDAWAYKSPAIGLWWETLFGASVLSVFAISECIARRHYFPLVALPVTFMIGLSCGLPLYLFLRTKTRA